MPPATNPTVIVRRARPGDRPGVERLLAAEQLPLAGVERHFSSFLVAVTSGGIIGAVGLERYGDDALLRSAVVAPEARSRGIGALLAMRILDDARANGVKRAYLLTTTAAEWFERYGFRRIERSGIPAALAASDELSGACPDSAVCMEKILGP